MAERGAQVVGDGISERFQLFVSGSQIAAALLQRLVREMQLLA
jgi:hypothetical protein